MSDFPTARLFPTKVGEVCDQIRRTLFRQAIFKVQNVEVTYMDSCKSDRALLNVTQVPSKWSFFDIANPAESFVLREELWKVKRCEQMRDYRVRYYSEGKGDGFSTSVIPTSWKDRLAMLYFYVVA